jgi:uncharacterized membrane protein YqjE
MATDVKSNPEMSTTSLVAGIVNDAQELFKEQLELFKAELKQDMTKAREGAAMLFVGAGLSFVGLIVLAFALAHLLWMYIPAVPLWGWYAIAGGSLAAIGVSLVGVVLTRVEKAKPLSESATALEENVEWKTNPK